MKGGNRKRWDIEEVAKIVGADSAKMRDYAIQYPSLYELDRGRWITETGVYALLAHGEGFRLKPSGAMDKWNAYLNVAPPHGALPTPSEPGASPVVAAAPPQVVEGLLEIIALQQAQMALLQSQIREFSVARTPDFDDLSARATTAINNAVARAKTKAAPASPPALSRATEATKLATERHARASGRGLARVPGPLTEDPLALAWRRLDEYYAERVDRVGGAMAPSPEQMRELTSLAETVPSAVGPAHARFLLRRLGQVEQAAGLKEAGGRARFLPDPAPSRPAELGVPEHALPSVGRIGVHQGKRYLVVDVWKDVPAAEHEAVRLNAIVAAAQEN